MLPRAFYEPSWSNKRGVLGGVHVMANIFPLHREEIAMMLDQPIVEEVMNRGDVLSCNGRCQLSIRV